MTGKLLLVCASYEPEIAVGVERGGVGIVVIGAAEVGAHEKLARRAEFCDKAVPLAVHDSLRRAGGGGEIVRGGFHEHPGVAVGVDGNSVGLVAVVAAEVAGVGEVGVDDERQRGVNGAGDLEAVGRLVDETEARVDGAAAVRGILPGGRRGVDHLAGGRGGAQGALVIDRKRVDAVVADGDFVPRRAGGEAELILQALERVPETRRSTPS